MQIEAKLNKANFDATYEAVVIEVPSQSNGLYKVKIQNAIVEAASTGGTYYKGETVYVNVPRNDPNQQKFIIGRKPKAGDTQNLKAFDFKYPFDYFVPLTDLLNSPQTAFSKTSGGYLANYPQHGEKRKIPTPVRTDPNCIWYWTWGNQADNDLRSIGETIGVQADWITYLAEYQPMAGDYGLRFVVNGIIINDEEREISHTENYYFNTREMYGNPYAFYEPETQQILFDVSKFKLIKSIEAYFWQDHKFVDINNNAIPYENSLNSEENPDNNNGLLPPNILFSNLKILYGMHVNNMKNENVFITTYDSRIFGTEPLSDKARSVLDKRTLNMSWVHKNEKVHNSDEDTYSVINSVDSLNIFNQDREDADKAHIYWYRETPFKEKDTPAPSQDTYGNKVNYAGVNYRYLPGHDDKTSIDVVLDIELAKESFKVVIEYNNTYAVSEALTFYNENRDIESNLNAAQNGIIFKLFRSVNTHDANTGRVKVQTDSQGKAITDAEGNAIPIQTIINDDTVGNFFVYDENNKVLRNDDDVYFSSVDYFIQVWIYNEDQSTPEHPVYVPLTNDVCGAEDIKWSYPSQDTMIASFGMITATELDKYRKIFAQGSEASDSNTMAITRKFRIRDYWDLRATDNAIMVTIKRNGRYYSCTKELQFGQAGSTGSQYTIVADVAGIINGAQDSCIHKGTGNFKITARLYDQKGNLFDANNYPVIFNFELLNKNVCTIANASFTDADGFTKNVLTAVLNSDYPPIYKISCDINKENIVSNDETFRMSYPIYTIIGCSSLVGTVSDTSGLLNSCGYVGCPNRIEYKSDGTTPIYNQGDFIVRTHSKGSIGASNYKHREYLYPVWELIQFQNGTSVNPSKIKYVKLKSQTHKNEAINSNVDTANKQQIDKNATKEYTTYSLSTAVVQGKKGFYWEDAMIYDTSTYLVCYLPWGGTFYQAIAFAHNVYPSSLLNSWNGQLVIDKEKNAILTRMLSAGVKDSENRFSGVLLGDWSEYGDDSIDPIGLYGFAHGIQTYGFKVDGTGFIGAAGDGQITFDGNHALISDYTHDHYINLNPQKYTYNSSNDSININSGTYSQYFLYAKNQKIVENNSDIQSIHRDEYGRISVPWIKKFQDDITSDYFVVDPNNGVYMSGGIVARYGIIGNCLQLSEAGLTYKKNNGIIFIGQERTRDGTLVSDGTIGTYDNEFYITSHKNGTEISPVYHTEESDTKGRYVIWAGGVSYQGSVEQIYQYPFFGIEHNGSVHMANAYIHGAVRATSLDIIMEDGEFHDVKNRFARTYYSPNNPANVTTHTKPGICNHTYGDMLLEGDIWYDTHKQVVLKSLQNAIVTGSVTLNTASPASDSTQNYKADDLKTEDKIGYNTFEWTGNPNAAAPTGDDDFSSYKGWKFRSSLSADTINELSSIAEVNSAAITSLAKNLSNTLINSYDSIRNGMAPLSFYEDGNCYVHIGHEAKTDVGYGIGSAPAGVSIYQLKNGKFDGSSMHLNGKRMGFYKAYTPTNSTITVQLPLLAYYDGNMALAGNLLFGMDVTAVTSGTDENNGLKKSLYANELDGINCKLKLGNGAIILDGGYTANTPKQKRSTRTPSLIIGGAPNDEEVEEGLSAEVYIGANSKTNTHVQIGALGNSNATIQLAGFDIIGNTQIDNNTSGISTLKFQQTTHTSSSQIIPATIPDTIDTSDTWTISDGDGISLSYNYAYIGETNEIQSIPISSLNNFSITHNTSGIDVYENNAHIIFAPKKQAVNVLSHISGWDTISSNKMYVTNELFCQNHIIANAMYCMDNLGTYLNPDTNKQEYWVTKVATERWVLNTMIPELNNVKTNLITLINALKKSKAPYNHSHS